MAAKKKAKKKAKREMTEKEIEHARVERMKSRAPRQVFLVIGDDTSYSIAGEVMHAALSKRAATQQAQDFEIVMGPFVLAERKRN